MKNKARRKKLFKFYNEVGTKYPSSNILYKSGAAQKREKIIKDILCIGRPKEKTLFLTLDIGCQDGRYKKYSMNYIGLDISVGYLKKFSGRRINAEAQNLPFRSGVFRRILLLEILEHVWERKQVLDECHRILQDGGTLIFSAPYGDEPFRIQKNWKMLGKYNIKYMPYVHGRFNSRYIKTLFNKSNFKILWLKPIIYKEKQRYSIVLAVKK